LKFAFVEDSAPGIPTEMEYVSTYCRERGHSLTSAQQHWNFYLALSFFRLAAIAQVQFRLSLIHVEIFSVIDSLKYWMML